MLLSSSSLKTLYKNSQTKKIYHLKSKNFGDNFCWKKHVTTVTWRHISVNNNNNVKPTYCNDRPTLPNLYKTPYVTFSYNKNYNMQSMQQNTLPVVRYFFCWSFAHEQNNIDLLWFIVTKPAAALLPYSLSSGVRLSVRPSILPFVACLSWQQQPSLLHHIVIRNFLPSLISVLFFAVQKVFHS